jgi:hypothetical protein
MHRPLLVSLLSLAPCLSSLAFASSAVSSWDALPPETALAVRIPDGSGFFASFSETRVGRQFLGEARVAEYLEILGREGGDNWRSFREKLGEAGLEPRDLLRILKGDSGAGLVMEGAGEPNGMKLFALIWASPGEELGARVVQALLASLKEQDGEHRTLRVDLRVAGRDVIHLAAPQTRPDEDGRERVSHNAHTLLTRDGERILVAVTLMSGPDFSEGWEGVPPPSPEPGPEMLGLFARFIQAHEGGSGGFSEGLRRTSGLQAAMPPGVAGLEMAIDVERLVRAGIAQSDDPTQGRLLEALGFLGLGKGALRIAIDENVIRSGGLLSAPAPRRGLVEALTDQRELPPRPAAWVPSHVLDYTHVSLDLGRLFARLKPIILEVGGEGAEQGLRMAEMQVNGMLQTDIETLLSSLGQQHTIVTFPAPAGTAAGDLAEAEATRVGIVWSVRNEEIWQRVMDAIAMFAPMMGEALGRAEEQGFSGWRMETEGFEGGLLLGRDQLVLAMGRGTLEEVLSALRNPPDGENAIAATRKYQDAERLLNLRPGLYSNVVDVGRQMSEVARLLKGMLEADEFDDEDFPTTQTVEQLLRMLDPKVIREGFGMALSQVFVTRDGIVFESVSDLAPGTE